MPKSVSRRQWRMLQAILHGKVKDGPRGRPPKSVAEKYTPPDKNAPETSGKDKGGTWGEEHHKRAKEKSKKNLKKAREDNNQSNLNVAVLVMNNDNKVLIGKHVSGKLAFPGGSAEIGESAEHAALRELKEETGVEGRIFDIIYEQKGKDPLIVFLGELSNKEPIDTDEIKDFKWLEIKDIPWNKVRPCCVEPMKHFIETKMQKSIQGIMSLEELSKNIIRQRGEAVLEVSHGDALRLVGTGLFRFLRKHVKTMADEDFKDIHLDSYVISIRKHMNDVYSGRVNDGHEVVYQFTQKSLPEMTAALMSVFEWYLPEDEKALEKFQDENISDADIDSGLNRLIDDYKKHNIGNIYQEMETIREQIRNGVAVDLQQVEQKIMTLFDKLETIVHDVAGKHNSLKDKVSDDIDELERKLRELQDKVAEIDQIPSVVEAYSSNPRNKDRIHEEFYSYLTKPKVEILPNGKITISFGIDWQDIEKENFLKDIRAKMITRAKSNG